MNPRLIGTYRLQLRPEFGFAAARRVLPYLAELGVSHLYLSPCFEAVAGSSHGYDVSDFGRIREELGGVDGFRLLASEAAGLGLGLLLDIVPHHMSTVGDRNPWWWDVLQLGRGSRFGQHFDIDWDPPESKLRDTVLLPVLGDHFGRVLENREISVEWTSAGRFQVRYHDVLAPLSPASVGAIVEDAAVRAGSDELGFAARALRRVEADGTADPEVRDADIRTAVHEIARLAARYPDVARAIDEELAELNGAPDALDRLLAAQHYRLARWQVASQELDYRRFFDIATLVALRSEREEVFDGTHALVLGLVEDGTVVGLRVDHADGLLDPLAYFDRLRHAVGPDTWLLAEKILRPGELLPAGWPVDGTTGYDFVHRGGGVLVDPAGVAKLREAFGTFTESPPSAEESSRVEKRRAVLREGLAADLERLAALLVRVCERHRRYRDFTRPELRDAIVEVAAHAPAYRSYVRLEDGELVASEDDVRFVETAIDAARAAGQDMDTELLHLLSDLLTGKMQGEVEAAFTLRFQQLTGPVAAKGEEDTAFYTDVWLLSLNEVGSGPEWPGARPAELHRGNETTQARWPRTMLTTSTHDTKRSEDVRARLALLSEMPDEWAAAVQRWSAHNEVHRSGPLPDRRTEWLLYQTLVGAHPLPADRAWACMEKSIREANEHTSWVRHDELYEAAVERFVRGVLADDTFMQDLDTFVRPLVEPGRISSLTQTVLRLLSPGVPDTYQGCELWDDSLVDPDNRRPVDFGLRQGILNELVDVTGPALWRDHRETGSPKLFVIKTCLALRRRHDGAFGERGTYEPLDPSGRDAHHLIAFARGTTANGASVVAVVPRLVLRLGGSTPNASLSLPPGPWLNVLTGDTLPGGSDVAADALLEAFPVCVLERAS